MPSGLYDKARQKFLDADIDWTVDTIKVVLIDAADYVVDLVTHEFLSSVPAVARVGAAQTLTGKTSAGGVAKAANPTFPVVSGDQSEAILIYKDTGAEATSPLVYYNDQGTGLPVTPTGADIRVEWNASGIFKL